MKWNGKLLSSVLVALTMTLNVMADEYAAKETPELWSGAKKSGKDTWYIEFGLYPIGDIRANTENNSGQTNLNESRKSRFGLQFGAGVILNPKLHLGGELSSFQVKVDKKIGGIDAEMTVTASNLMAVATYFPWEQGFFARGGLGFSGAKIELDVGNVNFNDSINGYGALVGVGYAWKLGKAFHMSAKLDYAYQYYNDTIFNSSFKVKSLGYYALGVGFHWF